MIECELVGWSKGTVGESGSNREYFREGKE